MATVAMMVCGHEVCEDGEDGVCAGHAGDARVLVMMAVVIVVCAHEVCEDGVGAGRADDARVLVVVVSVASVVTVQP